MTIQDRILECVRDGAETIADLEVDLNFSLSRRLISAHVSNLVATGRLKVTGVMRRKGGNPPQTYAITDQSRASA